MISSLGGLAVGGFGVIAGSSGIDLDPPQQRLLRHSDAAPARHPHYRQDAGGHPAVGEGSADIQRFRDFLAAQQEFSLILHRPQSTLFIHGYDASFS